jgi:hypothetical protein
MNSPAWHRKHHHTEYWAGDFNLKPGPYHEGAPSAVTEPALPAPKVSVLLLNWKRVENLLQILGREADYAIVDEILVCNNNQSLSLHFNHPKVKILNLWLPVGSILRSQTKTPDGIEVCSALTGQVIQSI